MAQTEKYASRKEEMQKQKTGSQGMLNATIGREVTSPLGRPAELPAHHSISLLMNSSHAQRNSRGGKAKEDGSGAEAKVKMAKKILAGRNPCRLPRIRPHGYVQPHPPLTSPSLQIRQEEAVLEANASLEAKRDLQATEYARLCRPELLGKNDRRQAVGAIQRRTDPKSPAGRSTGHPAT
jgi:hypothetical protein